MSITGGGEICEGTSVTLTATSGHSGYSWEKLSGQSGTASGNTYALGTLTTASNTYRVTATGTNSCTNTATASVTKKDKPSVSIDGTTPICSGETLTLTATSGHGSYAWSNGTATAGTQGTGSNVHKYTVGTITSGGTYSVTATGSNGCSNTASKAITVNPIPAPSISSTYTELTCSRTSITLTATGDGGTFSWSGGGTGTTNTVSLAGEYTVTETKNGCSGTSDEYEITSNTEHPTVSVTGTNEICLGESTTLATTINANYTYLWSNTVTTYNNPVTPDATTTYTVTTTDSRNGCETTGQRIVTVNTPIVANASAYDYIWKGGTTDWNTASNWYMYSAGTYYVASVMSETPKNYYVGTGERCLPSNQWPTLSAVATVGNVTIDGGSVIVPDGKTLRIAGSVSGAITARNGSTIELVGSNNQTFSDAQSFYNVTFNKDGANAITATGGININGDAIFRKGIVTGNVTFGSDATSTGANLNSYIDGMVTKNGGATDFVFPTGNSGVLGTVKATGTGTTSVSFSNAAATGGISDLPRWWNSNDMCGEPRFNHVSNFEYWEISNASQLTNVTLTSIGASDVHFNSQSAEYEAGYISAAVHHNNCWDNVGGSAYVSATHDTLYVSGATIPANGRSGGKEVTFGSTEHSTLLPIELLSFTATCNGKYAELAWSTASERNNDYFILERSDDAINFTEVARVAGAGNSIEQLDYTYNDYGIHGGDNYYRLVQVDYDGTRTVSEIVVATCVESEVGEPDVQAYPNPFNGELTIELDNFDNRPARIEVYDMLGKLIVFEKVGEPQNSYEMIMNLSNLPPAAYTIRVSTADFVINKQVVKQ